MNNSIAEIITNTVRELNISEGEVARRSGVSQSTINRITSGQSRDPRRSNVLKIAEAIGLTEHDIYGNSNTAPAPAITGYIPLIAWVQAGSWQEAIDLYQPGDSESTHPTTKPHSSQTFALRVEGDSMTAPVGTPGHSFPHGMIIYIDPDKRGSVTTGDYVIAKHSSSGNVTFKRLDSEEGRPVLKPLNTNGQYPIMRDEFDIIGKVIDASWGDL